MIFEHFFNEDILIKVTLIDFIIDICETKWNAQYMIENGFIERILAEAVASGDVYGLINHRFILSIAFVYHKFPDTFSISDDYYHFLRANMESNLQEDKDCVLNALFVILQHKKSLERLTSDPNFIVDWLRCSNYLSEDLRKSFFMSLKSLLFMSDDLKEDYNETIYKIFSNVKSPENYTESNGSIKETVSYIAKYVMLPVEPTESKINYFLLLSELIQWHWGYKELFRNGDFVQYLLSRKVDAKEFVEAKYKFIEKAVMSPLIDKKFEAIDTSIAEQLKTYYKNGVYGVNVTDSEMVDEFQYATEKAG